MANPDGKAVGSGGGCWASQVRGGRREREEGKEEEQNTELVSVGGGFENARGEAGEAKEK